MGMCIQVHFMGCYAGVSSVLIIFRVFWVNCWPVPQGKGSSLLVTISLATTVSPSYLALSASLTAEISRPLQYYTLYPDKWCQ